MLFFPTFMPITASPARTVTCIVACLLFACGSIRAQNQSTIGLTLLEATTNLNGGGIRVGQVEASQDTNGLQWEVNPAAIPYPASRFTWYSNGLSSTSYPNSLGTESGHAIAVGSIFYGPSGTATNVAHVDHFEANTYFNLYVYPNTGLPGSVTDAVVNQSYTFGTQTVADQEVIDSAFDNFQVKYNTLFVSAANNIGNNLRVCAPGTSYNCISVGAYPNISSVGPTIDNGRCKPDIT